MADFCKQCSIDLFGEDHGDLSGLFMGPLEKDYAIPAICEGCGFIMVDLEGNCVTCDLMIGRPGHGPTTCGSFIEFLEYCVENMNLIHIRKQTPDGVKRVSMAELSWKEARSLIVKWAAARGLHDTGGEL